MQKYWKFISKENIACAIFLFLLLFRGGYFYYESFVFLLMSTFIVPAHYFTKSEQNKYIYRGQLILPFLYFLFYFLSPFYYSGMMHYYGLLKVFAPFWLIWGMMFFWKPLELIEQIMKAYIILLALALLLYGWQMFSLVTGIGQEVMQDYYISVAIKGRFTGFLQYANVNAIISLLAGFYAIYSAQSWLAVMVCGLSLGLSGSRTGWLLAILLLVGGIWIWLRQKKANKEEYNLNSKQIIGVGIRNITFLLAVIIGIIVVSKTLGENRLDSGLQASELHTRLLYYKDGLQMILHRPWGYGHYGYYLSQRQFQTGSTYWVKYIHNFLLQLILDGGIICAMFFLLIIGKSLYSLWINRTSDCRVEPVIAMFLTLLAHAFWDFDFEFNYILLIFWTMYFYALQLKIEKKKVLIGLGANDVENVEVKKAKGINFIDNSERQVNRWENINFPVKNSLLKEENNSFFWTESKQRLKKKRNIHELFIWSLCWMLAIISVNIGVPSWYGYQGKYRIISEYQFTDARIGLMLDETEKEEIRVRTAHAMENDQIKNVETFAFLRNYYYNKGKLETAIAYGKEAIALAPLWIEHRQELMRIQYAYVLINPQSIEMVAEDILSVPKVLKELKQLRSTKLNVHHRPQWEMTEEMEQWYLHFKKLYEKI